MSSPGRQPLRDLAWEVYAPLEYFAFALTWPLLRAAPRGDGRPVLVIPGLGGDDTSTAALRCFLRSRGFDTHGCRAGRMSASSAAPFAAVTDRLVELADRRGPVSLVGVSLGGMFARELARRRPEAVRQIVCLATPIWRGRDDHNAARLYRAVRRRPPRPLPFEPEDRCAPLVQPATAIYSRTDGFVRWAACLETPGPLRENVEVRATHTGLAANPTALFVVADRLAQPEGAWRPFSPPPGTRYFFPAPPTQEDDTT
jgi:pimeloyl-ACP methyl ester carboxylesterase